MPGKVFDAVRDFGASTALESSGALQACINAAAAAGARAMCYLPAGVYSVNRTLTLCGAQPFSLTGGGSGFTTLLRWGPQLPPPGATVALLAAGPGAGCAQGSNVAIEKLNAFTAGANGQVLDFVASRTPSVPASPVQRHAACCSGGGAKGGGRVKAAWYSHCIHSRVPSNFFLPVALSVKVKRIYYSLGYLLLSSIFCC
jgi:hypothetical protein